MIHEYDNITYYIQFIRHELGCTNHCQGKEKHNNVHSLKLDSSKWA